MVRAMWQRWIFREPSLAFGLPLYLLATIAMPLHLGWIQSSWLTFGLYLLTAAVLFSVGDALRRPGDYPGVVSVLPQAALSLMVLAAPAALAFAAGGYAGGIDERSDERVCVALGAFESDSVIAEANDSFDLIPDCVWP